MFERLNHEEDREVVAAKATASQREMARSATSDAARMTPSSVLSLQRSVGNAITVSRLASEQEGEEKEDEESVQPLRADAGAASTNASQADAAESPVHSAIASGGTPLDTTTRRTMEQHFGEDFSDVRLHIDARSADAVQAAAYTVGSDIVMHPGRVGSGTPAGQHTLAHELTHVVQQRSGPVDGTPAPGGIKLSDPSDRFEREAEASASAFAARSSAGEVEEDESR